MENDILYASNQGQLGVSFEEECNICKEKFFCVPLFREHMLTHDTYIHECELCYARYQFKEELDIHKKTHVICGDENSPCSDPQEDSNNEQEVLVNTSETNPEHTHDPLIKSEPVNNPEHYFPSNRTLKTEQFDTSAEEIPLSDVTFLVCNYCGIYEFENWSEFEEHTLTHVSQPRVAITRLDKRDLKKYKVPLKGLFSKNHKKNLKFTITVNPEGSLQIARKKGGKDSKKQVAITEVLTEKPGAANAIENGTDHDVKDVLDNNSILKLRLSFPGITINPTQSGPKQEGESKDYEDAKDGEQSDDDIGDQIPPDSPSDSESLAASADALMNEETDVNETLENLQLQSSKQTTVANMPPLETEFISLDSLADRNKVMSPAISAANGSSGCTTPSSVSNIESPSVPTSHDSGKGTAEESSVHSEESNHQPATTPSNGSANESQDGQSESTELQVPNASDTEITTPPPNEQPKLITCKRFSSWNCNTCQQPFNTPEELGEHQKTAHAVQQQPMQMPQSMQQMHMQQQGMGMQQQQSMAMQQGLGMSQQQGMSMQMQMQQQAYQGYPNMQQHPLTQMANQQIPMPPMVRIPRHMMQNQGLPNSPSAPNMQQMPLRQAPPPPYQNHQYMNMPRQSYPQSTMQQMYPHSMPNQSHNSILAQSLARPPHMMQQHRNMPNLVSMNQQQQQMAQGQKRPAPPPMRQMPQQNKMPRTDNMHIPPRQNDKECQIISVQKRTEGMPIIQNVQGAAPNTGQQNLTSDSTIHLSESITLSRCTAAERPQNNDASTVTSLLATRGITVTPAAGGTGNNRQNRNNPPAQPSPQTQAALASMQMNSSISIKPTGDNSSFAVPNTPSNRNSPAAPRPPRCPTVDLTQDVPEQPGRRPGQNPSRITCYICDKQFASQEILKQHMTTHQTSGQNRLPFRCNMCNACYPSQQQLQQHKQQYHKDSAGSNSEMGLPVVNLKNQSVVSNLSRMGITAYIPVSHLQQGAPGNFGIPIVFADPNRPLAQCQNLKTFESTAFFPLGPMRMLGQPR